MNAKFQMHYRLREFANPSRPPLYPTVHIDMDTLSQSLTRFSKYIKSQFISSYSFHCTINDCYTCQNWLQNKKTENMQYLICHIMVRFIACLSISISVLYYITHEAACESLHDLDFCSQYLTTCFNVWTLYTTIFPVYWNLFTPLIFIVHVFSSFYWTPPPCTKLVYHTYLSLTNK